MIRVGRKYEVAEILPLISDDLGARRPRAEIDGYSVRCGTLRLRCFKHKGTACVACKIEGAYFALEQSGRGASLGESPHLNLYALDADGAEVLMTSDHIVALADGGPDLLDNLQTMCQPCNAKKGSVKGGPFYRGQGKTK